MRRRWARLGLRGRLTISIAAIVLSAFAVVFVTVRHEMDDESRVIKREEHREALGLPRIDSGEGNEASSLAQVEDAQSDVERTFLVAGGLALVAALLAGYLLAARTAAPLRRMAATASAVDAGDLTPRIGSESASAIEVRTLAESFDHMLDRLDEAFSRQRQFVSDASHELRTPLTAIRGQLEVLTRSEDLRLEDVRRVERLAMVEMARIERLIGELLTLARLDEGAQLERREIEVDPFLRGLANQGSPGAQAIEVGALTATTIVADPDRLTQVIRNLLANARRHAGPGGRVALSAVRDEGPVSVRVDDDGPGVEPRERELVFDRFRRSEAARDRGSGGSGLGLAIARSIVELHGGRIWIEESPLGGARVAFELPGSAPSAS